MSEYTSAGSKDPNAFATDGELLRHIYRELQIVIMKMEQREKEYSEGQRAQDTRILDNKEAIIELRTVIRERDKSFKTYLTVMSVGVTVLSLLISIAFNILK